MESTNPSTIFQNTGIELEKEELQNRLYFAANFLMTLRA
jgi:hypothetical protein